MENNNKRGNNLEKYKEIEKSIMTTYRKRIWNKKKTAINKIAVEHNNKDIITQKNM